MLYTNRPAGQHLSVAPNRFSDDSFIYDDNDNYVSPTDDDYEFWKSEQESLTNPLSDDFCKYANE